MAIKTFSTRLLNLTKKVHVEINDSSYIPFLSDLLRLTYSITVNNPILFISFVLHENNMKLDKLQALSDEEIVSIMNNSITDDLATDGIHAKDIGLSAILSEAK